MNKQRKSIRLPHYDYTQNGMYYITICTHERMHYFGEIVDGKMFINNVGKIATECWVDIPKHFPFVELDEFVIMPNHVHGILTINKRPSQTDAGTQNFVSLQTIPYKNKFGPQSENLGSIMRGYKVGVKAWATKHNIDFTWQSRFYERVIRNETELLNIRTYIQNNVQKWAEDEENI